jgi:hypothetical protein
MKYKIGKYRDHSRQLNLNAFSNTMYNKVSEKLYIKLFDALVQRPITNKVNKVLKSGEHKLDSVTCYYVMIFRPLSGARIDEVK